MMLKRVNSARVAAGTALLGLAASPAFAAMDTTAAEGAIADAGVAVATIGAAAFLVVIGVKVWRWLKSAA